MVHVGITFIVLNPTCQLILNAQRLNVNNTRKILFWLELEQLIQLLQTAKKCKYLGRIKNNF